MGPVTLAVPQARGVDFYPSSVEKGIRSERALKLAVAEMYVQGVSTRKVAAIAEQLCGVEISSAQVSRVAALLDADLKTWRERPLGAMPYLILDARYEKVRHGGSVVSPAPSWSPSASTTRAAARSSAPASRSPRPSPTGATSWPRSRPEDCTGSR